MSKQKNVLMYAGFATQFLVGMAICVWLGRWADGYFRFGFPVGVWLLPILYIIKMLYQLVKSVEK
ncbi:MAG: hypothetical protein EAY72_14130 [Bacteroidetes bacterium]|nr:MAG: hypothetical protein EAY72_14130 [Bacteroidota bacterium]TAE67872.1 MAG: hypothetical protein EAY68_05005 [Bacteroidota bacterium]